MNRILTKFLVVLSIFLGPFTIARTASAQATDYYTIKGNSCFSKTASVSFSALGISNTSSTTSLNVICPVTVPNNDFFQVSMSLTGYQHNNTVPTACTLSTTDGVGDEYAASTASLGVGNESYSLDGFTDNIDINYLNPYHVFYVQCTIPPKTSSGNSWVTYLLIEASYYP